MNAFLVFDPDIGIVNKFIHFDDGSKEHNPIAFDGSFTVLHNNQLTALIISLCHQFEDDYLKCVKTNSKYELILNKLSYKNNEIIESDIYSIYIDFSYPLINGKSIKCLRMRMDHMNNMLAVSLNSTQKCSSQILLISLINHNGTFSFIL